MTTMIHTDLCDKFTREGKGKGRPPSYAKCAVCDASYAKHYPMAAARPKLAFPQIPETCTNFTKLDGKRGKPAPGLACAVCSITWSAHSPRGSARPVKHPERMRPEHIPLGPKQGSTFGVPSGEGKVKSGKSGKLAKQAPETPKVETIIAAKVEPIIEPKPETPKAKVEPIIEPKPETPKAAPKPKPAPKPKAIIEEVNPWAVPEGWGKDDSETAETSPDINEEGDDEEEEEPEERSSNGPSDAVLRLLEENEEKEILAYMARGMTREEAEAKVDDDNDW